MGLVLKLQRSFHAIYLPPHHDEQGHEPERFELDYKFRRLERFTEIFHLYRYANGMPLCHLADILILANQSNFALHSQAPGVT
jgi:hypothetical protein